MKETVVAAGVVTVAEVVESAVPAVSTTSITGVGGEQVQQKSPWTQPNPLQQQIKSNNSTLEFH